MVIPSLTDKKSFAFKSIFSNKLNDNIKVNRHIIFNSNKEEDYSNAVTAENSNNYNKNYFKLNHDKNNNISPNFNEDETISNQKSYVPLSAQKKSNKKYERWNSIKKLYQMNNDDEQKESFYPCTAIK